MKRFLLTIFCLLSIDGCASNNGKLDETIGHKIYCQKVKITIDIGWIV